MDPLTRSPQKSPTRREVPLLPPPTFPHLDASPTSSHHSHKRASKLKRSQAKRQQLRASHQSMSLPSTTTTTATRQSTTPTPSIKSTTSSLTSAKNFFSSLVGNLKAGVSGAWTKAKGETETYLASQEGENRMQMRRKQILGEEPVPKKRPVSSDGALGLPAMKKRSLNMRGKLKKQKSEGKLALPSKTSISYPSMAPPGSPKKSPAPSPLGRPIAAPVYRSTTGIAEEGEQEGWKTRAQSMEMEISALRAKLKWFEQSYGEIPSESIAEIQQSMMENPAKKPGRRSVFKEELGSIRGRGSEVSVGDESFLPEEVKQLKGYERDNIDVIAEEDIEDEPQQEWNFQDVGGLLMRGQTIKLVQPSPSSKSVAISPPRPSRQAPSPPEIRASPPSSPTAAQLEKSVDLLETLSPIHPNIMPALIPRPMTKETIPSNADENAA